MSQAVKRDSWNIFLKPLDPKSWVAFIVTTITLVLGAKLLLFLHRFLGFHAKIAKKFAKFLIFLAWIGFVLTFGFYQGVLTMFFSTKVNIPFQSMKDVIRSYPKWKLMIRSGDEAKIIPYVKAGDPDFLAFWDRIQHKSDETLFSGIEEVLTVHDRHPVVISIQQGAIDKHRKYGKPEQHDKLEVFQREHFEPYAMIVTKNSPLGPILKYAAQIMQERGVFGHLKLKWTTRNVGNKPLYESETLTMTHLSLTFVIFAILLGISFVIFLGEMGTKTLYQRFPKLEEKWSYIQTYPEQWKFK